MGISIAGVDLPVWVSSLMERWHVSGFSLSVIRNVGIVYSGAMVNRDIYPKAPMTAQTLLPIGSLTKSFVFNAAAILVERGVIDRIQNNDKNYNRLDDPVDPVILSK